MRRRFMSTENKFSIENYLTVHALEDGLEVTISATTEYCVDGGPWVKLLATRPSPTISTGQYISFRANFGKYPFNVNMITINKYCELLGNCNSLVYGDNASISSKLSVGKALRYLFKGCDKIVSVAPNFLPSMILEENCYQGMFEDCTSLTTAPELPATTLADSCYSNMFYGCSSLTTAPELPATTLASNCYIFMFNGCSKLNYIKAMFTTTSSSLYTYYWVLGVASSGTFVKNKNATWDVTGVSGIPSGWDVIEI